MVQKSNRFSCVHWCVQWQTVPLRTWTSQSLRSAIRADLPRSVSAPRICPCRPRPDRPPKVVRGTPPGRCAGGSPRESQTELGRHEPVGADWMHTGRRRPRRQAACHEGYSGWCGRHPNCLRPTLPSLAGARSMSTRWHMTAWRPRKRPPAAPRQGEMPGKNGSNAPALHSLSVRRSTASDAARNNRAQGEGVYGHWWWRAGHPL